jgi:hypothetical protein
MPNRAKAWTRRIVLAAMCLLTMLVPIIVTTHAAAKSARSARHTVSNSATSLPAWQRSSTAEVAPSTVSYSPLRVSLYGDSLAYQAQEFFKEAITNAGDASVQSHTFGGTAICDWLGQMQADAATERPQAVVVEFSGNALTPCMRDAAGQPLAGAAKIAKYTEDIQQVVRIFGAIGSRVYFVGAPISRAAAESHSTDWGQLNNMYAALGRRTSNTEFVDADEAVENHGAYTDTLPCLMDEPCTGGVDSAGRGINVVRALDGVHFCPGAPSAIDGVTGTCSVWSSGSFRYGTAMAAPVIKEFVIHTAAAVVRHKASPVLPKVAVVGDSITHLSAPAISAALGSDYAVQLHGINGATIAQQTPTLLAADQDPQGPAADIVYELGTNDAVNPSWQADFANSLTAMAASHCVVFVAVSPILGMRGPAAAGIDLEERTLADVYPTHYHVLDWGTIEYRQPGWVSTLDAIHPTRVGSVELASLEKQALASDCRAASPVQVHSVTTLRLVSSR